MRTIFYWMRVIKVMLVYRLDVLVFGNTWAPSKICHLFLFGQRHRALSAMERGQRLRMALEHLGPIWIKFGQLLSTRYDLLPSDIIESLAMLQDAVTPFPPEVAEQLIQQQLQQPIEAVFTQFDRQPLAQASIAQVHTARLKREGREVVIKLLRPGIAKKIRRDVHCLYGVARCLAWCLADAERLKPMAVVAELEHSLKQEICLLTEAANATTLKRHFPDRHPLLVPEVFWDYCTPKMMVMERIHGVQISDVAALEKAGVNFEKLAKLGVDLFFTQVLRDSFFHADMHPGNVFVDVSDPENPGYVVVDFGIMGTLNPEDQRYIAENLLAFFNRDYRRVAVLHVASGWVPADTRIDQFEAAIRTVCEPIFSRPLKDISFGLLFMQLLKTARTFKTDIQPQLILLQKTLLSVESLGRRLYPELNLWQTAQPQLARWVKQQVGVSGLWRKSQEKLPLWLENMPELPELVYHLLQKANAPQQPITPKAPRVKRWPSVAFGVVLGCVLWSGLGHVEPASLISFRQTAWRQPTEISHDVALVS